MLKKIMNWLDKRSHGMKWNRAACISSLIHVPRRMLASIYFLETKIFKMVKDNIGLMWAKDNIQLAINCFSSQETQHLKKNYNKTIHEDLEKSS